MSEDNHKFILPKGFSITDTIYDWKNYIGGDGYSDWETEITKSKDSENNELKCECGTSKTLGKDDDPEFHSYWCPMYKKSEKK